eukprot:869641-Rhodomonas_salina.2
MPGTDVAYQAALKGGINLNFRLVNCPTTRYNKTKQICGPQLRIFTAALVLVWGYDATKYVTEVLAVPVLIWWCGDTENPAVSVLFWYGAVLPGIWQKFWRSTRAIWTAESRLVPPCYAFAMRCPVLPYGILLCPIRYLHSFITLRVRYAVPRPDAVCRSMRCPILTWSMLLRDVRVWCYAMSGTDMEYAATMSGTDVEYAGTRRDSHTAE